ncbi:MAG TPA: glycosyltransferase family 4 protein [Blastocatellia bacterium]|nr:glycosyltransferase family 4 protein [Blastocatellia bacterium]
MKIGIVTHYMPPHIGGIELVADSLYDAYRSAGFEARWVAARSPDTAPSREDGRIRVRCWNGLERRLGVPWPVLGLEGVRELKHLVRWADLLHVHDSLYAGTAVSVRMARNANKPILLSQHIGFVRYPSAVLNAVEHIANKTLGRAMLRSATHVVFCTSAAQQFASALLNGRVANTSYIPNGIDTGRFRPPSQSERASAREMLKLSEPARIVLFVGRLVEKKGVDVLAELIKRMSSHVFLIVGDGPLRTTIPTEADNVGWFPRIDPEAMAQVYQAADVFILPSHGEGLPLSVQEAMATGLPAVVTKDEAFTAKLEQEGACLATARTVEAFRQALERLAGETSLSASLSARSRELALREWSLDVMTARYLALIRELTAKH